MLFRELFYIKSDGIELLSEKKTEHNFT